MSEKAMQDHIDAKDEEIADLLKLLSGAHDLTVFISECEIWFDGKSRHPLAVQARNLRKELEKNGINSDDKW